MKLCLTANSGGHLNQLLQLKYFFKKYDYFFITDKNAFSEELAKTENVYFIDKFVFKEILLKKQFLKPIKNLFQSIFIFVKEKPDLIITTGAGTAFGPWLMGKVFKKTIFIESIARTNEPSTFGKRFGSKSSKVLVQWEMMLYHYKDAICTGIIFNFNNIIFEEKKIKNIFITVGTYKLQFDRIFMEIDSLLEKNQLRCNVIAQIGSSTYKPKNFEFFDYCGQKKLHEIINKSDLIICQGGSGSIMDSLLLGKRVISVPRLVEFKEFFDNHQIQLVSKMEELGLILAVYDIKNLHEMINKAEKFKPDFKNANQDKYTEFFTNYFKELKLN